MILDFLEFQYRQADSSMCYRNSEVWLYTGVWRPCLNPPPESDIGEKSLINTKKLSCQKRITNLFFIPLLSKLRGLAAFGTLLVGFEGPQALN